MKAKKTISYYQKKNNELKSLNIKLRQHNLTYINIISSIIESEDVVNYVDNLQKELLKD